MKRLLMNMAAVALTCAAVSGCSEKTEEAPYGSNRAKATVEETASAFQQVLVAGEETTYNLHIKLDKAVSRDVQLQLGATSTPVNNFNKTNFTSSDEYYQMLGNDYYSLNAKVDIPKGATEAVTSVTFKGLPAEGKYALGVNIAASYVDFVDFDMSEAVLYLFYREGEPAPDPAAPPTVSLSGSPATIEMEDDEDGNYTPQTFTVTVSLSKKYDKDIVVSLEQDTEGQTAVLPAECFEWSEQSLTFTAESGETRKTATLTVNSLPAWDAEAHDGARGPEQTLRVKISGITPEEVVASSSNKTQLCTIIYPKPRRKLDDPVPAQQKAVVFTGYTGTGQQAATLNLGTHQQWTLEYWVRFEDKNNYGSNLNLSQWTSTTGNYPEWRRRVCPPENVPVGLPSPMDFKFWPQAGQATPPQFQLTTNMVVSDTAIRWEPGKWYHVAITYDGANVSYFINGVPQKFYGNYTNGNDELGFSYNYDDATSWSGIKLAYNGTNGTYASGLKLCMAQLRLWSVVRTESEIADNMGYSLDPATDGLEAYWRMDEASGTTLTALTEGTQNITSNYIQWSTDTYDFTTEGK
ncbi:MAG: DUF1735 domain-containing protein [Alistipes sp.]|nr:DUF1735 domain-containing protein [Alistipes sp.]